MIYSQLLVSTILILCGFLVKRFPNLIAGYNTLSKADKEKIDIKKLSSFLKYILVSLGILGLFLFFYLKTFDIKENTIIMVNATIIVVVIIAASFVANTEFKN